MAVELYGHCPHCNDTVLLRREEIDVFLAIILAIFTAGFGVLIYLLIYYNQEPNHCVHCNSVCEITHQEQKTYMLPYHQPKHPYKVAAAPQNEVEEKAVYCPNCGNSLEERGERNFCPLCGVDLME